VQAALDASATDQNFSDMNTTINDILARITGLSFVPSSSSTSIFNTNVVVNGTLNNIPNSIYQHLSNISSDVQFQIDHAYTTISIGLISATTISYGSTPTVLITNTGSDKTAILNFSFGIPEGHSITGPQGPAGSNGSNGADGADGADGRDGANGDSSAATAAAIAAGVEAGVASAAAIAAAASASASAISAATAVAAVEGIQLEVNALTTRVAVVETEDDLLNTDVDNLNVKTTGMSYLEGQTTFTSTVESANLISNGTLYVGGTSQFHDALSVDSINSLAGSLNLNNQVNISAVNTTISNNLKADNISPSYGTLNMCQNVGENARIGQYSNVDINGDVVNIATDNILNVVNIGNQLTTINLYGTVNTYSIFGFRKNGDFLSQF
jgi:hypothetical protein